MTLAPVSYPVSVTPMKLSVDVKISFQLVIMSPKAESFFVCDACGLNIKTFKKLSLHSANLLVCFEIDLQLEISIGLCF